MKLNLTDDLIKSTPYCIITYVLELENNKWYVGKTTNLNRRVCEHFSDEWRGAIWTGLHKPIQVWDILIGDFEIEETLRYMEIYGSENVRGGPWCKEHYPLNWKPPYTLAEFKKAQSEQKENTLYQRLTDKQFEIYVAIKGRGKAASEKWLEGKGFVKSTIRRAVAACLVSPPLIEKTPNGYIPI